MVLVAHPQSSLFPCFPCYSVQIVVKPRGGGPSINGEEGRSCVLHGEEEGRGL